MKGKGLKIIFIPFISLLFLSFFQNIFVEEEIRKINREIEENNLKWKAGITSMSILPPEERRLRLGTLVPIYLETEKLLKIQVKVSAPSNLDWRNLNGFNWLTSVKNQGSCGSCWAFSVMGVVESIYRIERQNPSVQPNLSEQDLVSCCYECFDVAGCKGGYPSKAADFIKREGVVTEECFPYQAKDVTCNRCSDWQFKLAKIRDWGWVSTGTTDNNAIINAIQDGPLSFYMEVYSDFYHYTGGIYEPTPGAKKEGGHAIVLVGYNTTENYWICKNSWGENWGENGYFKIKMGVCDTGKWVLKLWGVNIFGRPPVLSSIPPQEVKEGEQFLIQLKATDPDGDTITYKAEPLPSGATIDESKGTFKWTPSYTQSGEYTVRFSASDGFYEDYEDVKITVLNVKRGKGRI